ncbi:MAG TPA: hypothetical protein VGM54_11920 [Chthoniobacter sp.]|jgi:hypothetical protein
MRARISIVILLVLGLLFGAQAQWMTLPMEMKTGGICATKRCARGCCANAACCKTIEQQKTPQSPAPAPQISHLQLATIGLRAWTFLFLPPAARRPFVALDELGAAHTLPPLAVSCIRLI